MLGSTIQMKADDPYKLNNNLMCYPSVATNLIVRLIQIVYPVIENEIDFQFVEVLMHFRFDHHVPYKMALIEFLVGVNKSKNVILMQINTNENQFLSIIVLTKCGFFMIIYII